MRILSITLPPKKAADAEWFKEINDMRQMISVDFIGHMETSADGSKYTSLLLITCPVLSGLHLSQSGCRYGVLLLRKVGCECGTSIDLLMDSETYFKTFLSEVVKIVHVMPYDRTQARLRYLSGALEIGRRLCPRCPNPTKCRLP